MYLETSSRRENLKFENIVEENDSREDTESVLRDFLETELALEDVSIVLRYRECTAWERRTMIGPDLS